MSKLPFILAISAFLATGAHAQAASGGIAVSTDPAKIAAIEKHAQELKATQAKPATHSTTKNSQHHKTQAPASTKAKAPTKG